ncbi:hypothetical protein PFAG_00399 [Plasmodium falciparum Santa Lucia]|uniref:Uncharacterized protein n=1 Tax=Plasmodium falciparum Santa Lucia TaxID=478859 RepID=W7GC28_PLAFA|nr:hypothetical protein PFAG_00399 [Plasmodium falciparum Santa Lucia]
MFLFFLTSKKIWMSSI